ncbi:MAG: hypothetical protein AAF597_18705, partial [Bacteroidota bacterium]
MRLGPSVCAGAVAGARLRTKKASKASKAIAAGDDLKIVKQALQEFFGTKQVAIKYDDKKAGTGSFT